MKQMNYLMGVIKMNETFVRDVYCGESKSKDDIKGWIAFNISDEKLSQYNGRIIKVIINVIEDLGIENNKEKVNLTSLRWKNGKYS